jgi:hypothetical protein
MTPLHPNIFINEWDKQTYMFLEKERNQSDIMESLGYKKVIVVHIHMLPMSLKEEPLMHAWAYLCLGHVWDDDWFKS